MNEKLSPDEVAILIRARKIINSKGLSKDIDVKSICEKTGISRKTGYLWAEKSEKAVQVDDTTKQEFVSLKEEHEKLKQLYDDVCFENRGHKIARRIHGVDEFLARKKTTRYKKRQKR